MLIAGLLSSVQPTPSSAGDRPDPRGVWLRDDGNARVRIAPCGAGAVCATNLWIRDTSKGEAVGDRLVMTLAPRSATTLAGKAYDPKRKLTYSITVDVREDRLTTRGCVAGGLLCRDVSWTPAK
jgi:uncharacterized protein (DUF2147 family)